jgi:5'-nucleotidase
MDEMKTEIIHIDMDDTICDYSSAYRMASKKCPDQKYPQSQYGFFTSLKPLPNSIEIIFELDKIYDVYILTRPSIYNPLSYTEKAIWIKDHLGFNWLNKLILACNKSMLKGDYLIDDSITDGQLDFEGELIRFGTKSFPDWISINNYLLA